MRLIDADKLIEAIDPMYKAKQGIVPDNFAEGCMQMEKLIKQQPTAYDVGKVIDELEGCAFRVDFDDGDDCMAVELDEVIGIVKDGGVE